MQERNTRKSIHKRTRRLTLAAMFAALAYLVMVVIHIPLVPAAPFLTYDPKDVILAVCGFTLGPLPALLTAVVVAFLEMITVSSSGIIGFAMNLLSTAAFLLPPSLLYARKRSLRSAALGLALGVAAEVGTMLVWNYFITPLYMGTPREAVAEMLLPVFLPFNLIKGALNAAITMLVYKPVSRVLRRAGLTEAPAVTAASPTPAPHGARIAALVAALVLLACLAAAMLLRS